MPISRNLITASLLVLLFTGIFGCERTANSDVQRVKNGGNSMESENTKTVGNPYFEMRTHALSVTPEDLQVKVLESKLQVVGFIMDWNLGNGSATFVTFCTGDGSMYTSSGGGIIGGIGHENVRKASLKLIDKAQSFVEKATRSDDSSLAKPNGVKFFFLTNRGRYVAEESMENFDNGSSQWLELFAEANKFITELRSISADFDHEN